MEEKKHPIRWIIAIILLIIAALLFGLASQTYPSVGINIALMVGGFICMGIDLYILSY